MGTHGAPKTKPTSNSRSSSPTGGFGWKFSLTIVAGLLVAWYLITH